MMKLPESSRGMFVALVFTCACSVNSGNEAPARTDSSAPAPVGESAAPSPPKPDYPAAEELLAGHVRASGGADKIAKFESIYVESKIDTGKQKLQGTSKMWWKPGKFMLEEEIEGVGISQIAYDGQTIWMKDPINGLRRLEGREAAGYIQASSSMFPAHEWQKFHSKAETVGKSEVEGKAVWEVLLTSKEGPNLTLGIDVESGMIRSMKTKQVSPMGEVPFEVTSSDYRDIEGYKFAFTSTASISGLLEITTVATKFEVNVEVDEAMFAFPAERPVVPADPSAQPPVEAPPAE